MFRTILNTSAKALGRSTGFLGGVLVGTVGLKALKSDTFNKVAVGTIAKGMHLRDSIYESVDHVIQQGGDLLAEAEEKYEDEKKAAELAVFEKIEGQPDDN